MSRLPNRGLEKCCSCVQHDSNFRNHSHIHVHTLFSSRRRLLQVTQNWTHHLHHLITPSIPRERLEPLKATLLVENLLAIGTLYCSYSSRQRLLGISGGVGRVHVCILLGLGLRGASGRRSGVALGHERGLRSRLWHGVDARHEFGVLGILVVVLQQQLAGLLVERRFGIRNDQQALDRLWGVSGRPIATVRGAPTKRMCLMPRSSFQSFLRVFTQISPVLDTLGWKILVINRPVKGVSNSTHCSTNPLEASEGNPRRASGACESGRPRMECQLCGGIKVSTTSPRNAECAPYQDQG